MPAYLFLSRAASPHFNMLPTIFLVFLLPLAVTATFVPVTKVQDSPNAIGNASSPFDMVGFVARGLIKRDCVPAGYVVCPGAPLSCCPPGATCCEQPGFDVAFGKLTFHHLGVILIERCAGCCSEGQVICSNLFTCSELAKDLFAMVAQGQRRHLRPPPPHLRRHLPRRATKPSRSAWPQASTNWRTTCQCSRWHR